MSDVRLVVQTRAGGRAEVIVPTVVAKGAIQAHQQYLLSRSRQEEVLVIELRDPHDPENKPVIPVLSADLSEISLIHSEATDVHSHSTD